MLVGAWLAVHALAKRGIGRTLGVVEDAYPSIIKQETKHGIDDVQAELSNGEVVGRRARGIDEA